MHGVETGQKAVTAFGSVSERPLPVIDGPEVSVTERTLAPQGRLARIRFSWTTQTYPFMTKWARLRKIAESVKPHKFRTITFRSSWGAGFRDSAKPSLAEMRCQHDGYGPAKLVCADFMENGSTEFPGMNARSAISCLSSDSRFASRISVHAIAVSFSYGTDDRGSLVNIRLAEDDVVGGMALTITAEGY
jgi:hypothetical protein